MSRPGPSRAERIERRAAQRAARSAAAKTMEIPEAIRALADQGACIDPWDHGTCQHGEPVPDA